MGLFGLFMVEVRGDGIRLMTDRQLCEIVVEDSKKSNYNWHFTTSELAYNCAKPGFQEKYAKQIKMCILNCYGNIKTRKEEYSYSSPEDRKAVSDIYNSFLKSKDEEEIEATKKYFNAILASIIKYDSYGVRFPIYCGDTYYQICDEWKKRMMEKYYTDKPIEDWEELEKKLNEEFTLAIKTAKEKGVFEQDKGRIFKIVNRGEPKTIKDLMI